MSLIRAIINILTIVFKTAIFLVRVIFRFRLIVLLLLAVGSILVNISLFTGTFYFENFNSIFQTITRTAPVAYQDREEIRITKEELAASKEALNDQNAASIDLKKKIEQLSQRIDKDAEAISEKDSENELLKGLVRQNEKLNETLREKNADLSNSRLSGVIRENNTLIETLQNNISKLNENLSVKDNQITDLKDQLNELSQNLLVKDSRILDLKDQLDELSTRFEDLKNDNSRLENELERRNVKGY
jgi:chromosome segregation ATPase